MKYIKLLIPVIFFLLPSLLSAQAELKYDQGYKFYLDGDYLGAIDLYTAAIDMDPIQAEYYYHRGVCYSLIKKDNEAIADFNKAIGLDESYAEAYFERGYSYYIIGNNEAALTNYDRTLDINPDYAEAYVNRGTVKFDTDDLQGACVDWRAAEKYNLRIATTLLREYCD